MLIYIYLKKFFLLNKNNLLYAIVIIEIIYIFLTWFKIPDIAEDN